MNYTKTNQDYLDELTEQLELLCDYCQQLDRGALRYAKPLATLIRVLVHQTPKSDSLFTIMKRQKSMKFCSTSKTYPNQKNIIYLLTLITPATRPFMTEKGLTAERIFVPNLEKNKNPIRWIGFDEWYENIVFVNNKDNNDGLIKLEQDSGSKLTVSRKDIITFFANKDGGAHVSEKVKEDMHFLSKSLSSMEYDDVKPQTSYRPGEKYVPGIPIKNSLHAALRQIAHELMLSITREFKLNPTYYPTHKEILGYELSQTYDRCHRFNPKTRELSTSN